MKFSLVLLYDFCFQTTQNPRKMDNSAKIPFFMEDEGSKQAEIMIYRTNEKSSKAHCKPSPRMGEGASEAEADEVAALHP